MKKAILKHKVILLTIFIIFTIFAVLFLVKCKFSYSKYSQEGMWSAEYYRALIQNPKKMWSGYLYYNGDGEPTDVSINVSNSGEEYQKLENSGTWDDTCSTGDNINRLLFKYLSFSFNTQNTFGFVAESSKPKDKIIEIKWKNGDEYNTDVIYIGKDMD